MCDIKKTKNQTCNELGLTILLQGLNPMSWNFQVSSCEKHKLMKDGKLLFWELICRVHKTTVTYGTVSYTACAV